MIETSIVGKCRIPEGLALPC